LEGCPIMESMGLSPAASRTRPVPGVPVSIEIRHLRLFIAVAEELHFTRAADRLHVAQPAISAQIKRLEGQLQVPLFERSTRAVRLTPEGELFFAAAKTALEKWDEAFVVAASLRQGQGGSISLGVSLRINSRVRVEIQRRLVEVNPRVRVDFVGESSPRLVDEVARGRLDIALCLAPPRHSGLRCQPVRDDPVIAALPVTHRLGTRGSLALAELRHEEWVLPGPSHRVTAILRDMCRAAGFELRPSDVHSADYDDEFTLVARGHGIEVVPSVMVPLRNVAGVAFVPIEGHTYPLELVYRPDGAGPVQSALIRAVLESQRTAPQFGSPRSGEGETAESSPGA
jgi:DNA-binding transcriptional LysR family regulator